MKRIPWVMAGLAAAGFFSIPVLAADPPAVDYNRDVRPILSNRCFKCHGPATQKSGVRLDSLQHAIKKDAVVPGKPADSLLVDKIAAMSDEDRMPPAEAGPRLSAKEVDTLKKWIAGGAVYAPHWSFVPPVRPAVPKASAWAKSPIDAFIEARLTAAKIKPSTEADKVTLIRRVTLDLTGLLPSSKEVNDYLADTSP